MESEELGNEKEAKRIKNGCLRDGLGREGGGEAWPVHFQTRHNGRMSLPLRHRQGTSG